MQISSTTYANWKSFCKQKGQNPTKLAEYALMAYVANNHDASPEAISLQRQWQSYLSQKEEVS